MMTISSLTNVAYKVKENIAQKVCASQKGAMFGLDSRIALAIFAAISVIAGSLAAVSTNTINAQGFTKELRGMKTAIDGIHRDMQRGLHSTLITDNSANAFAALYDDSVISATYRNKWVGPYVERTSSTHPKFGTMLIERLMIDHSTVCGAPCYLWLTYDDVSTRIVTEINDVIDGEGEASASSSGLIQWTGGGPHKLWYNIGRAIN